MNAANFVTLPRQKFRQYFQPSRVLLGLFPADVASGVNVITLCFNMHCSYKPAMMAVAIQNVNASYGLAMKADEFVLAVPGESLVKEVMYCGIKSLSECDKVKDLGLTLIDSETIKVPGLAGAIANIELKKQQLIHTGDHVTVVGRVLKFGVNTQCRDRPLLSIGPDSRGYTLLERRGVHRLGVVDWAVGDKHTPTT